MWRGASSGSPYNPANVAITGGNVAQVMRVAIPFARSPTGSMGNNGVFTAGTAFTVTVPKCYMYFAANQIAAGVGAGWYYTEGSTTTAFIVYNNTWTTGSIPTVPVSKTAFVTTGPGATTGDTTEQGVSFTIPAARLGASGFWKVEAAFTNNNTAGNKTSRIRFGGLAGTQIAGQVNTTGVLGLLRAASVNQVNAAVQAATGETIVAAAIALAVARPAVNTAVASEVYVTTLLGTATDWEIMEWATFEMMGDGT